MTQTIELVPFSQTEYQDKVPNGFPVGCPTLDLSASWDASGKNLLIYRPSDQIVTKIHQIGPPGQKTPEVQTVTWRPDGQFLAVGWSDGYVRLMGLENNKAAHHIKIGDSTKAQITHIGWASNSIVKPKSNAVTRGLEEGFTQDTPLDGDALPMDLPHNLAFLEIDTALPKISPLPAGSAGAGEDVTVFTLRTGIEFLFQPLKKEEYNHVNAMITGTSDGKLQLNICDSFTVGSFPCPLRSATPAQLIRHAAHRQVSTQALLLSDKLQDPDEVHLVPMDLPFITSSPINLSLLTSKLTTLQKLLRYLKQTQYHMQVEWKNTRELPMRFLTSVQEDLEKMETGPRGVVPALYHLAVTGHVYEPMREWLVDSLAERGHKRWDKAVSSGFENLRALLHENFLPALDRFNVILSRLRGLAMFFGDRDEIGFSLVQIGRLMDAIGSLSLVGHRILILVMDELDGFRAFSSWLRFQIDRLASSSSATEELTEKEATMDTSKVLTYIEHHLTQSSLSIFFDQVAGEDHDMAWTHIEDGTSLLDELDKQLNKGDNGQLGMKALPHVEFLIDCLAKWSNRMFNDIAEAQKQNVRFGESTKLSVGQPITQMDMRMCSNEKGGIKILITLASKEAKNKVDVFSVGIDIVGGISRSQSPVRCRIDLGTRSLIDLKFLNDTTLLILCSEQDDAFKVIRVPVHHDQLKYSPYDLETLNKAASTSADKFDVFSLPRKPSLRPIGMDVYDKCDTRGVMPARVCLLESNRTVLRTFALPDV